MDYSYLQLQEIKQDINNFIDSQEKLSSKLLFSLRWNLRQISAAEEIIQESLSSLDEEQQSRFQAFQKDRMELVESHGGEIKRQENNAIIANFEELNSKPEFQQELTDLMKEYEDILEQIEELDRQNIAKQQEKIAEVDWKQIPIDQFPDQMDGSFSESFLEFTNEA